MICFPNAKINLGLQVTIKRDDGFHNLRSVFYPVPLYDVLECKEAENYSLTVWNNHPAVSSKSNLITKAWHLISKQYNIPPQEVHLIKNIPSGSGLGGASADAMFFLKEMLSRYHININKKTQLQLASELCSDCPFFIHNKPAYVIGRGNVVEPLDFTLSGFWLVLAFPEHPISTVEAFGKIKPIVPQYNLKKLVLEKDFKCWKATLYNDFETIVPSELTDYKRTLYDNGAIYASMTGSGSAFFGIFNNKSFAISASQQFINSHIVKF